MNSKIKCLNAALIILYDRQNRILLQHRTVDAERLPDCWAFFGGQIDVGESPLEAVYREAFEELNCRLRFPRLVLERDFELENARGHLYIFVDKYDSDKQLLELREGQGWGWFDMSGASKLKMIEHDF